MNYDSISKFVFQLDQLAAARSSELPLVMGDTVAFCDFAAGGDENVLAVRRGNKVQIAAAWRDEDTMRAVYRFIHHFRSERLRPQQIFGDNSGLGKVMIDSMREQGWDINRVDNGSAPESDDYANRGAEIWHEAAGMLRRGEIILPLHDAECYRQLASRKVAWSTRGLGVEKKEDMKKDGRPSPDRADAVCAASVLKDKLGMFTQAQSIQARWDQFAVPMGSGAGGATSKDEFAALDAML
jgi:hypothetical protein